MEPILSHDPTSNGGRSLQLLSQVLAMAGADSQTVHKFAYSLGDIHIDSFLSNFSIDYRIPETLLADQVMPVVQVAKASDYFAKWSRDDANKVVDAEVGPRDLPGEIYQSLTKDNYVVIPRAMWAPVSNDLLIAADAPLDLLGQASRDVRAAVMKSREYRVAQVLMTAANYTYSTALTGSNRWDVGAATSTADPLNDILTGMDKAAYRPNQIAMSAPVWTQFRKHPKVVASVGGIALSGAVTGRVAAEAEIKGLLRVDSLLIGDAKYRTSKDGVSPSTFDFIWGKGCALLYTVSGAGPNQLCFAKTFRHKPISFETIFDQKPGMGGVTFVKGSHSDAEKITASDAAYFIDTCIS